MTTSDDKSPGLNYAMAGVDINAGNALVDKIKPIAKRTHRPGVLSGLGGFGALFELPLDRYRHPVLVAGTDGVGTKLKLATALGKHDTIGIDLVAMCVNDLIVQGAEPLFFLDYYATGALDTDIAASVVTGIGRGCELAGCALIGGETAEMPGMYAGGDYDLAGFCVGVVEKDRIIDGSSVAPGDTILGIAASGAHSNGYSLIRKIIDVNGIDLNLPLADKALGDVLLEPTRIYVRAMLSLINTTDVHAIAHITGGGLLENIPRVLPEHCAAVIDAHSWSRPPLFQWLQEQGNISDHDMYRTFNCGIGMAVIVPHQSADAALNALRQAGETAWPIGTIEPISQPSEAVVIRP